MGTALGKEEEDKDKATVWLSPAVLARIKGEDHRYQALIRGMEQEYTEMKGISIEDFDDISRSVEEAMNPIKPVKDALPITSFYGRHRRS